MRTEFFIFLIFSRIYRVDYVDFIEYYLFTMLTHVEKPEELRAALIHLNLDQAAFAKRLTEAGMPVTRQAVWRWIHGRTKRVPGYVGYFLLDRFQICKESLKL